MSNIEEVERKLFSLWEDIAEARGFDRVVGTVICTLLIEIRPLSQQEIAEKTGYSIPTISKTLKAFTPLGSVRKVKKRGERTALYYVETSPLEMLSGALMKWIATAKTMEQRMLEICQELGKTKDENPERAKKLMNIAIKFSTSVPKMIKIIEKAIKDIQELEN